MDVSRLQEVLFFPAMKPVIQKSADVDVAARNEAALNGQ